MTLRDIYKQAIELGQTHDWRGKDCSARVLAKAKEEASQSDFDPDRLFNPYGDTRVACGDLDTPVESILVGIEIWPKEVLLAAAMRNRGKPVDLCISHHCTCVNPGLFHFDDILLTHKYALAEIGVPPEEYDPVIDRWIADPGYVHKLDTINTARNLDLPLLVVHSPCDLVHVARTRQVFAQMADRPLTDIVAELNDLKEFELNPFSKITIRGEAQARPGKVYNSVGAGWHPRPEVFKLACQANIDTAVVVEPTTEHLALAAEHGINVVCIPSTPNCNYGINIMLDDFQRRGDLTIYEAENFERVSRL